MPKNGNSRLRIRMYRVGFGDCFLITFPGKKGSAHVLVDCGVHAAGDVGTIERAVENIAAVTRRQLAVVIATHAHQDHISGFGKFAAQFRKFTIGEVWMPWIEDRNNTAAAKLKQKHKVAVTRLRMHLSALAPAAQKHAANALFAINNLAGNEASLEQLHSGFGVGAKVRYFEAGDSVAAPGEIAGLGARILGPPSDLEFLARMDPPASQHYMTAKTGGSAAKPPFAPKWNLAEAPQYPLSESELGEIHQYAEEPPDALAFALDQSINNTSLVVLFSFDGKHLLFPGDAQYGNWQYWLEKSDSSQILSGIDFLKVAHHGSMNATPKTAIDNMGNGGLAAMVSTQSQPWPSIPRQPLMDAILRQTKNRMLRSDSLALDPSAPKGPAIRRMPAGFAKGDFWFDYSIPL